MKTLVPPLLVVIALLADAGFYQGADDSKPLLSDSMSAEEILQALRQYPPEARFCDQRHAIMQSLDKLVTVRVTDHMTPAERARLKEIFGIYAARVDDGLDALENTTVTEGVHAFKFYSSSIILKSPKGIVAVDFCQGPTRFSGNEPEIADQYKTGFYLTTDQRDRLARLVDVQLITHRHFDHCDYSLATRLMKQGKPVVGPAQLRSFWKDIGGGVTVPDYETAQRFGPCEIFTQRGWQYGNNIEKEDGQRYGVPAKSKPYKDAESIRYLIRMENIVFLQAAENHVEADEWLRHAEAKGWKVNVLLKPGQYQGARSVMKVLRDFYRLPIHEYEMTHGGGGNRTAGLWTGESRKAIEAHRMTPLFWGDHVLLTKELLSYTYE